MPCNVFDADALRCTRKDAGCAVGCMCGMTIRCDLFYVECVNHNTAEQRIQ